MFGLQNAEKYKKKDERRLKTATVMVAVITAGLYIAFIISMLITKSGVLALFVRNSKPIVANLMTTDDEVVLYRMNFYFIYDRFNWLFDEDYAKLYFAYDNDFEEISDTDQFVLYLEKKYITGDMDDDKVKEISGKINNYVEDLNNFIQTNHIENFKFSLCDRGGMLILPEGNGKNYTLIGGDFEPIETHEIPNGKIFFGVVGVFLLVSAIIKIITVTRSYRHGKFVFKYGLLGVRICSILEVIGLIALTYVRFWLLMWDVPIFSGVTEPSMLYYLRFALPVILLNVLYTFLYNKAADTEED